MSTDEQWAAFDPGFDRGEVTIRQSNVDGVFSASKLRDLQGTDVRTANCGGQLGDEQFDWSKVNLNGADVRSSNCSGQIGSDSFDWSKVPLGGADVRRANCPNQARVLFSSS